MHLSKLYNVFVQSAKFICPNCKIYLSKLSNVFGRGAKICRGRSRRHSLASWTRSPQLYSTRYNEQIGILRTCEAQMRPKICLTPNRRTSWTGSIQLHLTRRNKPIDILGSFGADEAFLWVICCKFDWQPKLLNIELPGIVIGYELPGRNIGCGFQSWWLLCKNVSKICLKCFSHSINIWTRDKSMNNVSSADRNLPWSNWPFFWQKQYLRRLRQQ